MLLRLGGHARFGESLKNQSIFSSKKGNLMFEIILNIITLIVTFGCWFTVMFKLSKVARHTPARRPRTVQPNRIAVFKPEKDNSNAEKAA